MSGDDISGPPLVLEPRIGPLPSKILAVRLSITADYGLLLNISTLKWSEAVQLLYMIWVKILWLKLLMQIYIFYFARVDNSIIPSNITKSGDPLCIGCTPDSVKTVIKGLKWVRIVWMMVNYSNFSYTNSISYANIFSLIQNFQHNIAILKTNSKSMWIRIRTYYLF